MEDLAERGTGEDDAAFGWRALQALVWGAAVALWGTLLVSPAVGIDILWNILIPVAPLLLVFVPGLWRNICPLATTALISRHAGFSSRRILSLAAQGWLSLAGVSALYLIVPLRHAGLNTNGPAAAIVLAVLAIASFVMGTRYEWKSGWCSGLCPIHPVERLYGSRPAVTFSNGHCSSCAHCTAPCPESTPAMHPLFAGGSRARRVSGVLLVGGFPGFVWGWFHVPDMPVTEGWRNLSAAYGFPFAGLAVTLSVFLVSWRLLPRTKEAFLVRLFATGAVGAYYWYRVPALFGLGLFPGDGMLINLTRTLPAGFTMVSHVVTTALLGSWLLLGHRRPRSWSRRPPFEARTDRRPAQQAPAEGSPRDCHAHAEAPLLRTSGPGDARP